MYAHPGLCCHSNATGAPIANPPNNAQQGGSLYHAPSSIWVHAVVWSYGREQTHTHTQTRVTTIHFASSTTHAKCNNNNNGCGVVLWYISAILQYIGLIILTRRPASADRTARRLGQVVEVNVAQHDTDDQYNATVDRWSCHLPNRNKQCTCFQCGSLPLRSDIKGTELPPANILIPLERQSIELQLCR